MIILQRIDATVKALTTALPLESAFICAALRLGKHELRNKTPQKP